MLKVFSRKILYKTKIYKPIIIFLVVLNFSLRIMDIVYSISVSNNKSGSTGQSLQRHSDAIKSIGFIDTGTSFAVLPVIADKNYAEISSPIKSV